MRMNTKGHMVFGSKLEAISYAQNAGFTTAGEVARRDDMPSHFTLQRVNDEWLWYRPFDPTNYPRNI